jgi:hypothetical protein
MPPIQPRVGGSFAPPLTDEMLAGYRDHAAKAAPEIADAMRELLACVDHWWGLPDSKRAGKAHASGTGTMIPLEAEHADALDSLIPWRKELDNYAKLFDTIDPARDKALRDAAFHLLWHVNELDLGREPITADKL